MHEVSSSRNVEKPGFCHWKEFGFLILLITPTSQAQQATTPHNASNLLCSVSLVSFFTND
jgi:hypothetical protein